MILKNRQELTHSRLLEVLSYDPDTGVFLWKVRTSNRVAVGAIAGSLNDGYLLIKIDGPRYLAHRLAWFYVHGKWPAVQIDHENRVRSDNRIKNLREATNAQNGQNQSLYAHNTSGRPGVYWCKPRGKWAAKIKANGRHMHLGYFADINDAAAARAKAKAELHTFHPFDQEGAAP